MRKVNALAILFFIIQSKISQTLGFISFRLSTAQNPASRDYYSGILRSTISNEIQEENTPPPCYFKYGETDKWRRRIELKNLAEGDLLKGIKSNEDLLDGKTGPKVFFECGVGRIDAKNKWQIVNGMCRLGSRNKPKKSVIRKRVMKLKQQSDSNQFTNLYVTKIRLDNQQLEVSLSPPNTTEITTTKKLIPASTLKPGEEMIGQVVDVRDYGVLVDVNANRNGLLHIQKVADLYGRYINKEKGLEEAGLERGAKIRVAVLSNERKRLFLDFTPDVKKEALTEQQQKSQDKEIVSVSPTNEEAEDTEAEVENETFDEFDAAAWAEFAAAPDYVDEESYYDDYDDSSDNGNDEDRDIENSFGLGSY